MAQMLWPINVSGLHDTRSMSRVRVYELAKDLGVQSTEILAFLHKVGAISAAELDPGREGIPGSPRGEPGQIHHGA